MKTIMYYLFDKDIETLTNILIVPTASLQLIIGGVITFWYILSLDGFVSFPFNDLVKSFSFGNFVLGIITLLFLFVGSIIIIKQKKEKKKMETKEELENYWNDDLQSLFEVVDKGLRCMLRKKKITTECYNKWCKDTELSSIGEPLSNPTSENGEKE